MPTFETPPLGFDIGEEVDALLAEGRAETDGLEERERVAIQLIRENESLRAQLDDMRDQNRSDQENIENQEEELRKTRAALRRAEERVEAHELRLHAEQATPTESPAETQLYEAYRLARQREKALKTELANKQLEINELCQIAREATDLAEGSASHERIRSQLQRRVEELVQMLMEEQALLVGMGSKAIELARIANETYYMFDQVPSYGTFPEIEYPYSEDVSVLHRPDSSASHLSSVDSNADMGESGSNYSTYDNHLSMYYSSRRDSTPTVVTIDTEIEQIFLEEALTHSPAEEMTNVNSNTTIAGPLIPRPVSSNVWTEFRENVSPDVDSDDEDEPQFKRQCEKPLNGEDQGDKEDREPNQCWCSKLSIVDQNLAKQMASLVLNDRISLILNDQTSRASNDQSSPASYYPAFLSLNGSALDASNMESTTARTFNSIAVQTDETPVEDKEDVPISKVSKPFGARWSRSFALNSSGPVYLGPWYDYLWRRRFAEPIEKKSPRKRHFSPRRKVDLPLPDRVSPIRVTLAMPVTAGGTQFVRKEALPVEISESGTAPDTRMPEQTSTASLLPQDRPKSWGDWWLVILAAVLIIYLWHLGRHKPIDASWIEVNDVPHGVLEKLRDNQVSEFRFPEMVEYEVGQWIQLDRVAHG